LLDVPVKGTDAPLLVLIAPVTKTPAPASWAVPVQVTAVVIPAVRVTLPVVTAYVTPPYVMLHDSALVLELPELLALRTHISSTLKEQLVTLAETLAELVNDPKRPKTNPAMAMAAMSVIAIRITVARTGEIAFLLLVGMCMLGASYAPNSPVKATDPPLLSEAEPVNVEPGVAAAQVPAVMATGIAPAPAVMVTAAASAGTHVTPPYVRETELTAAFEDPVFWK